MDDAPVVLSTALKHGVDESDILHALRNSIFSVSQTDGMEMYVGPDQAGQLIEVGVVEWYGVLAIPHSMRPVRAKYLR
ncbi:MAG: hypothetical protein LBH13_05390 [Cellulomonadaceae bacterium]|nr:hypothetical protein [Cellulomonadaceae bacterium]